MSIRKYRTLNAVCSATPGVITDNTKFFPDPVIDPWLAARIERSKRLHHVVTSPDHGKTHMSTTEGNIHPALHSTVDHPHNPNRPKNHEPHPYSFVAHSQSAGGCRGC
jgi:hypothetical protein